MVTKMPRYKCEFAYVCPSADKMIYGKLEERILTYKDLEFFLRMMSPLNSESFLTTISRLKKGMWYNLNFNENSEFGNVNKVIRIKRN